LKHNFNKGKIIKKYLLVFIILTGTNLFASAPDTLWTRTFGGAGWDDGSSVQQTSDGGFIISGKTDSPTSMQWAIYLIKTNSSGDTLWTRTFGGIGNLDWGSSAKQTKDGGFIITGTSAQNDVYIVRTNSLGDTLWTRSFGGVNHDWGWSVQQTKDGGFIVAGETFMAWEYTNAYLIRIDSLGNTLWTKTYGGSFYDYGYSVQETYDGGFIVAGSYSFGQNYEDAYLIKTNSLGDTLWTRTYGGTGWDVAYSVQQTQDSGFIIAGETESFGAGAGFNNVYLVKTNSSGNVLWTRTYGGTNYDCGKSVQQTEDRGFIIAGFTSSFGVGSNDVYLIRTNSIGDTLWTKTIGGTKGDFGYSIRQTTDGGFIITGMTSSFGAGGYDVYLIRLGKEVGVEEKSKIKYQNAKLEVIKDKIYLSVPNNYYTNTLITICDLTGRLQNTLYQGTLPKGNYTFTPNIHKSGIYFVKLTAVCHSESAAGGEESNTINITKKLILMK